MPPIQDRRPEVRLQADTPPPIGHQLIDFASMPGGREACPLRGRLPVRPGEVQPKLFEVDGHESNIRTNLEANPVATSTLEDGGRCSRSRTSSTAKASNAVRDRIVDRPRSARTADGPANVQQPGIASRAFTSRSRRRARRTRRGHRPRSRTRAATNRNVKYSPATDAEDEVVGPDRLAVRPDVVGRGERRRRRDRGEPAHRDRPRQVDHAQESIKPGEEPEPEQHLLVDPRADERQDLRERRRSGP